MEVEMNVAGLHHHHHQQQEISSQILEGMMVCTKPQEDKKPRPPEEALKCPRCDSSNTKFCYYNNYSLTQPRYFCKSCRRYWTKGGTLRNVPVGGGCRRNRRPSSNSSSTSSSAAATSSISSSCLSALSKMRGPQDHHIIQQHGLITHGGSSNLDHMLSGLPQLPYDSTDLSLAFARLQGQANGSMGYDHFDHIDPHLAGHGDPLGFLDFLENTNMNMNTNTNTNNRFHHNVFGNLGNGELVGQDQDQEQQAQILNNPMFYEHQEQELNCSGAKVKQEVSCNMMRSSSLSEVELWGFHEVESGRSMIGGWNGTGSTNWHGLINSPLM
ncbi:hypothetical protein SSX86_009253 [Deinandra increscens subsp. villosa]|uniref:Dof zinc finger protein n=1 Tax=Deinandra increscens subsp. villosa TaxID=3103831 RepID=A0AAP0DKT1_9ASTR